MQLSIRLRYNYYVQLVAIERDWMPVPNLQLAKGGGGEAVYGDFAFILGDSIAFKRDVPRLSLL